MSGREKECNAILWVGRHTYFNMEFILVDGCRLRVEKSMKSCMYSVERCGFHYEQEQKSEKKLIFFSIIIILHNSNRL